MIDYIGKLSRTISAVKRPQQSKPQTVKGIISGGMVSINGVKYPFETTTDVMTVDGLEVWCQIAGDTAVILGA